MLLMTKEKQAGVKWDWDAVAVRLREQRKLKGLTQDQVADRARIGRPYLSQIESGGKVPTIDVLFDLITLGLGMSIQDFFGPLFPVGDPDNASIEAQSRALFERYGYDERTRRSVWDFLKFIDETYSSRRPRK